jgi:hypothetical protein
MAAKTHGRLANQQLVSAAFTSRTVYTAPTARKATVTVCLVNTTGASKVVSMGVSAVDRTSDLLTNSPADCLEPGVTLASKAVLERTGLTLSAGQRILADADAGGVYVHVWGVEEDAL